MTLRRLVRAVVLCLAACDRDESVETVTAYATVPSGFVDETVVTGLSAPTAMAFAPDGRLFVCEQGGALRVVKNGALLATPFLRVPVDSRGERGLLGVTFDPSFAANGFVYVYYTATSPTVHNRVSRFTASGDVAVAGSEVALMDLETLSSATNHNGGALHFGADGKLYVAVGENANGSHAQTLSNRFGKLLRLNADGSIPADNPFHATATGPNRAIWALGLRNPFTFAVQPGTGRIFINDVGQSGWEEIDEGVAGANYGWPTTEGPTSDARFRGPLFAYGHGGGASTGCAISGGAFYNPASAAFGSTFVGKYFYADHCSNWIRVFDPAARTAAAFATGVAAPVDLRVGSDGALYYLARGTGAVGRIRSATNAAPVITVHPASSSRGLGQAVTFTVEAAGAAPVGYQWQRDGAVIPGATSASYTIAAVSAGDAGASFRAVVSNPFGSAISNAATLTVVGSQPPVGSITAPAGGSLYSAGETISYAGTGSDAEDGALPASAFTWQVDFHHDTHLHPFIAPTRGATAGSFVVPARGETATNVFYRIHLTVTDSAGLVHASFRDIHPRTTTITLATSPPGLQVTLDGQPVTAPFSGASVVGMIRAIGAVSPQVAGGAEQTFVSWSDGGAATHEIAIPDTPTTYTATYVEATAATGLRGEYFDDLGLTTPRVTRTDASVNFDWGRGPPANGMGADTFSVRWTGKVVPRYTESYTLYTTSDDGIRLWIDGVLRIDNWTNHAPTENRASVTLTAGKQHDVRLEYFENGGGAVARLAWSSPSQPREIIPSSQLLPNAAVASGVRAEYFDELDLSGSSVVRVDPQIDFDWGAGSPSSAIAVETFSARWTGKVTPAFSETYSFYTTSDDGIRLWVNGVLVIDNWTDHAPTENRGSIALVAEQAYDLRLEYYERGGGATARLSWASASQPKQIVPRSRLTP